jgi:hypothetical protein
MGEINTSSLSSDTKDGQESESESDPEPSKSSSSLSDEAGSVLDLRGALRAAVVLARFGSVQVQGLLL